MDLRTLNNEVYPDGKNRLFIQKGRKFAIPNRVKTESHEKNTTLNRVQHCTCILTGVHVDFPSKIYTIFYNSCVSRHRAQSYTHALKTENRRSARRRLLLSSDTRNHCRCLWNARRKSVSRCNSKQQLWQAIALIPLPPLHLARYLDVFDENFNAALVNKPQQGTLQFNTC